MKRFVDVRNGDIGSRFAWYDTIVDKFESHGGEMTWDTFDEFAGCYEGEEIDRYRGLCPDWAFKDKKPIAIPKIKRFILPKPSRFKMRLARWLGINLLTPGSYRGREASPANRPTLVILDDLEDEAKHLPE